MQGKIPRPLTNNLGMCFSIYVGKLHWFPWLAVYNLMRNSLWSVQLSSNFIRFVCYPVPTASQLCDRYPCTRFCQFCIIWSPWVPCCHTTQETFLLTLRLDLICKELKHSISTNIWFFCLCMSNTFILSKFLKGIFDF